MNLDAPCTQREFGDLVGVSQQAVSDMLSRQVLEPGQPLRDWLSLYCSHLRETAAGRGADGELAYQRAEHARVSRERNELKLKLELKTYAPVAVLEQVLASVGRKIAGLLEPLPGQLHKLCPSLTPEEVTLIQRAVAKACDHAATAGLAVLDEPDEDGEPSTDDSGDVSEEGELE